MAVSQPARSRAGVFQIDDEKARQDAAAKLRAARAVVRSVRDQKAPPRGRGGQPMDGWESIKAFARGAKDSLPFRAGDRLASAAHAGVDTLHGASPLQAYDARMKAEDGQDRWDEAYHPTARTVGKVAGTAVQIAATGGIAGSVATGSRMAQATQFALREQARLGGIGAGFGVAAQGASDIWNRKLSSAADYAGAGIGGATGALMLLRGQPGAVGASSGAATSVAQDLLNGRRVDLERASDAAAAGNALGGLFNVAGRRAVAGRSPVTKGKLGESMSKVRTRLRGDRVTDQQVTINLKAGGRTRADHVTAKDEIVEAKFGTSHKYLRGRQNQAFYEPLRGYRVDHFLPGDIGAAAEMPAWMFSHPSLSNRKR